MQSLKEMCDGDAATHINWPVDGKVNRACAVVEEEEGKGEQKRKREEGGAPF